MLTQFSVTNFRSIKNTVTLDMQATAINEHQEHLIKGADGRLYLPVASIYGPNGSGKSNIVYAMEYLMFLIRNPIESVSNVNGSQKIFQKLSPFAFSEETRNGPSEFTVYYLTEIAEYRYEIHILGQEIIYESLSQRKNSTHRESRLFERNQNITTVFNDLQKMKISEDISSRIPLLSYMFITYGKNKLISDAINGFSKSLYAIRYRSTPFSYVYQIYEKEEKLRKLVLEMIQEMDIDVVDLKIYDSIEGKVFAVHKLKDEVFELNILDESNGTQKLFELLLFIATNLSIGGTLIIDEIDANIHPALLKHIIQWHTDSSVNQKGAQLIFTSHDLANMNNDTFRRDEIWFVAKGNQQDSVLYSLVEFIMENGAKVRNDARYDKQYLEGKYGADPYLQKMINWEEFNERN